MLNLPRTLTFKLVTAFGVLVVLAGVFASLRFSDHVLSQTKSTLNSLGFHDAALTEPEIRVYAARFKDITLDQEGISSIKVLDIEYSPFSLFFGGAPRMVKINGMSLIGHLDQNAQIDIEGWDQTKITKEAHKIKFPLLSIKNSELSLLTDQLGGISFQYDLQMSRQGARQDIQGHFQSRQRHLSFTANAKGFIHPDGIWQADIEIERGKVDITPVKASRVNGLITLTGEPEKSAKIISELRAGGLNLYGFPWQSASATFDGNLDQYQLFADMKSIGFDGIELGLHFEKNARGTTNVLGNIHTATLPTLIDYTEKVSDLSFDKKSWKKLSELSNLKVDFVTDDTKQLNQKILQYRVKKEDQTIMHQGETTLKSDEVLSGAFMKDPNFLDLFGTLLNRN